MIRYRKLSIKLPLFEKVRIFVPKIKKKKRKEEKN